MKKILAGALYVVGLFGIIAGGNQLVQAASVPAAAKPPVPVLKLKPGALRPQPFVFDRCLCAPQPQAVITCSGEWNAEMDESYSGDGGITGFYIGFGPQPDIVARSCAESGLPLDSRIDHCDSVLSDRSCENFCQERWARHHNPAGLQACVNYYAGSCNGDIQLQVVLFDSETSRYVVVENKDLLDPSTWWAPFADICISSKPQ